MAEGFQRGETVSFPIFVRDGTGAVIPITGGTLSVRVWWRDVTPITLTLGSGITILDDTPAADQPCATGSLTATQTGTMPGGNIIQVQANFVDSLGEIFKQPKQLLDEIAAAAALNVDLGGGQGPAGPPGLPDTVTAAQLASHIADLTNPHAVTKEQVGVVAATATDGSDATAGKFWDAAAGKTYVDNHLAAGFLPKAEVRAASTANLTLSGTQTVDNVALLDGESCAALVQTDPTASGVYIVHSGAWVRRTDMDAGAELPGALFSIREGDTHAGELWFCSNAIGSVTLGVTSLVFLKQASAPAINAGHALEKVGNEVRAVIASQPEALAGTALKLIDAERLAAIRDASGGAQYAAVTSDASYSILTGLAGGATDNYPSIQAKLYDHIFGGVADAVRVGRGGFRLSRGLNFGDGRGQANGRFLGAGGGYWFNPYAGTVFYTTEFINEPAASVQTARSGKMGDFNLIGPLLPYISAQGFGTIAYAGTKDDTVAFNWLDETTWTVDELAQIVGTKAPHCALAVDPRSYAKQSTFYRDVEGVVSQYSKAASSGFRFQDMHLSGYYVAAIVQPNSGPSDANGDFIEFLRITITQCPFGIDITQGEARSSNLDNIWANQVHTLFTNKFFGKASGHYGPIRNYHHSGIMVFDFGDTAFLGPLSLHGYSDGTWQEGRVDGSSSTSRGPFTHDAQLPFSQQTTKRGVPPWLFGGTSGFQGIELRGYRGQFYGFYIITHRAEGIDVDLEMDPRITELDTGAAISKAVKTARNATANFVAQEFSTKLKRNNFKFAPWNLDTGAATGQVVLNDPWPSNRTICTPIYAKSHAASALPSDPGVTVPTSLLSKDGAVVARFDTINPATFGLSGAISTRDFAGTMPSVGTWPLYDQMVKFGYPGDMALAYSLGDPDHTFLWVMTARSGSDYMLTLQNNYIPGSPSVPRNAMTWSSGVQVKLMCSRWYSPALPVYARFDGTAVAKEVGMLPTGTQVSANIEVNMAAGDYVVVDPYGPLPRFISNANAGIASLDNTAKTMTFIGNTLADSTGKGLFGGDRVPIRTLSRVAPT